MCFNISYETIKIPTCIVTSHTWINGVAILEEILPQATTKRNHKTDELSPAILKTHNSMFTLMARQHVFGTATL